MSKLFRKKITNLSVPTSNLFRSMNAFDLVFMGIGAIIGAGVFVLTGIAAAIKAGPAITLSYVLAGLASMLAALAYAELSASIGGTGSAYSYAYAGFGEIIAWIIGWDLLLEYVMSVSTVAIGWSGYVNNLLQAMAMPLPALFIKNPFEGGLINLLAVGVVCILTLLLSLGIKYSVRFNNFIVLIKLLTIAVFFIVASRHINIANWENFMPFGWQGVIEGAAFVFFAYIGFDALSTATEETINPQRNLPIGIIASVLICTLIYIAVSAVLTGIVSYKTLNVQSPVAYALLQLHHDIAAGLIAAGAIAGLTTVMLVMFYGLTRICLAMSRDGLLPKTFAVIHEQTHSPMRIILLTGTIIALIAGFVPIDKAAELVNIGTLAAFTFVSGGVIVFRYTHPNLLRPFKLPLNPFVPTFAIILCVFLMINLPGITWWRFAIWMILGLVFYFFYGITHSELADKS